MYRFVFTCGDVNGIGPEIVVKSLNKLWLSKKKSKYFFICPENILKSTLKQVKPKFDFEITSQNKFSNSPSIISIIKIPDCKQKPGYPTRASGLTSYKALDISYSFLKLGIADTVVTAPVSKTAIHLAGIKFPGQTEIFAYWSGVKNFAMCFLSEQLNVALQTIHLPIKYVHKFIKIKELERTFNVLQDTLKIDLAIKNPSIAVLGLNPHAGENGFIGKEELETIKTAIQKFAKKIRIDGPFPADAFFARKSFKNYNITLGMYHDQVLIPFKYINSGLGVNYTAGLKIVRTSPDHGVAYEIAGKNIADEKSFLQATNYAEFIVNNRRQFSEQRNI